MDGCEQLMFEAFFTDPNMKYRTEVINGIDFYKMGFKMVRKQQRLDPGIHFPALLPRPRRIDAHHEHEASGYVKEWEAN